MSYNKKTWANRESEYPNRYRMHSTNGNIADVSIIPNEGSVTVEGDKFNAATMNDMEQRIANGFTEASSDLSSAVNTLNQSITQERTRATGEENLIWHDVHELQDNLDSEIQRATGAEQTLTTNLSNEVTRATGIEQGLRTDVTALQGRMTNAEDDLGTLTSRIGTLENTIELESTRAQEAEETLDGKIDDETSRATNAETIISGNLTDEITRATTAETALSNSISAETTRATNSENILSDNILAETTRATGAETQLQTNLTAEVARATQAESDLHDYVDAKVSATLHPKGTITFANLPSLSASVVNYVYNISDSFTTTSDFTEGSGKHYPSGTNVAIVNIGTESNPTYKYDAMSGFIDTSHFITDTDYATNSKAGIVKPDGTTITIDSNGMISSVGGGHGSAEAAERMIAPIEADATESTHIYATGSRLILNELLYEVIDDIAIGDALVAYEDDPTNANIKLSDDVSTILDAMEDAMYSVNDSASTTINDTDYVPMSTNSGAKKKTLWSTIIAKIKSALATVATSGSYNDLSNKPTIPQGTVTKISTGAGLTGGDITGSGTIKADLKSETKSSLTATSRGSTSNREYPVGLDANGDLSVNVPWNNTTYPIGYKTINGSYKTAFRTQTKGNTDAGDYISTIRNDTASVDSSPQYGSGLAVGRNDTHMYLYANYSADGFYVGGGNADKLNWTSRVYTSNNKPSKSDVGLGSVANLDQSKAIKSITRSGTTFTATALDNTTFTFTQQDNNTTYSITQYSDTPASLAAFVQSTAPASGISLFTILRFKDTNNVLGFGANTWVKGYLQYQNPYGSTYGVQGEGIMWPNDGKGYRVIITGTTSFSVSRQVFRSPTGNATAAQVVSGYTFANASSDSLTGTFASQEKTVTGSRSAQTVTPDSGKWLSKVTVNKYPDATGTYTPTANSSASDMGATNNYRYVNTSTVYDLGKKAKFDSINSVFRRALSISIAINDEIHLGDRWFKRSSSAAAYIYSVYSAGKSYVGYGMVTLSSSGLNGSYSAYGQLNTTKSRTVDGITYYYAEMTSKFSVSSYSLWDIHYYPYYDNNGKCGVPYIGYEEDDDGYLTTLDKIVTHVLSKV